MSTETVTSRKAPASNGKLAKALLAAQTAMPAVTPDGTNPHFKSKFVTLGNLIAKVRPVLNEHGITFVQFPSANEQGQPTLVTILMHESGETLEYAAPLLLPKNDPQGQGSAITYMRRYALASALGISDQEDDDGHAGTQAKAPARATAQSGAKNARPISAAQKGKIHALIGESDASEDVARAIRVYWTALAGETAFDRMPGKDASALIERLEAGDGVEDIVAEIITNANAGDELATKVAERYLEWGS